MFSLLRSYFGPSEEENTNEMEHSHPDETEQEEDMSMYASSEEETNAQYYSIYSLFFEPHDQVQKLYSHKNKDVFLLPASLLNQVTILPYKYQREINTSHIQNIQQGLMESQMMYHNLILCHIDKEEITIMDGQHRLESLKSLPPGLADELMIQVDILTFDEHTNDIMRHYKYINTNVQIQPERLLQDVAYVDFIFLLKRQFPDCFVATNKRGKKPKKTPQQYINEDDFKKECQQRQCLDRYQPEELVQQLITINNEMATSNKIDEHCMAIERRQCVAKHFYLGIQFPYCLDQLV